MLAFIGDEEFRETLPDREQLLTEAASLAGSDGSLARLVNLYWSLVADDDIVGRSAQQLFETTAHHRRLATRRVPGEVCMELDCPEDSDGPDAAASTRVDIVCDDMPFLVDSLTGLFNKHGIDITVFVHPIVPVVRDESGELVEAAVERSAVEPAASNAKPDSVSSESWMHIELQRVADPDFLSGLEVEIRSVLSDVAACVGDWQAMRAKAISIAAELSSTPLPVPDKDIDDTIELLQWLADDKFTFLGFRQYKLTGEGDERALTPLAETGLGLLSRAPVAPRPLSSFNADALNQISAKRLLVITKSNARSTVHRTSFMDYIGVKTFDASGEPDGELRFLGLFTSAAYLSSVTELPVVRRKVEEVLARSNVTLSSHSGKDFVNALETYPRDELFQARTEDLYTTAMGVLRLAGRRRLRLFARRDVYGRFYSCLVYLPRDRYNTENRLKIQQILRRRLNGAAVDYDARVTESVLARLHFVVRIDPYAEVGPIDFDSIQSELADATRSWDADLALQLDHHVGEGQARTLFRAYAEAYPAAYKAEHTPIDAAKDIAKLEMLREPGDMELQLFRLGGDDANIHFKIYSFESPVGLSEALPVLSHLGVGVSEERPYHIARSDGKIYLHDFGLTMRGKAAEPVPQMRIRFENAFRAVWAGEAESDRFNELIVAAGLTWRQVVILRALAKYMRQCGFVFSQDFIASTLCANPAISAGLVALFEARFDPRVGDDRDTAVERIDESLADELAKVPNLDADRILRAFLTLIRATLRTSYFQKAAGGRPKEYVSFKFNARDIGFLPRPRPMFEVFVYSPNFEGVHMRYGQVARGGLRWSDRREDFRTEILGLVKAQEVKNTVITPSGAKGGFVLKRVGFADRADFQAEGVKRYREFISSLLDITDNRDADNNVVPPPNVVRHDGDDPYLVVAADKGTATFSDIANAVAASYGFWLGDAFASGGSVGYDHKKMGITARGAWESVKRHFRAENVDTQSTDFTVVGIGDMSGDVFGNGMLLAEHIRLVAAFNHMHIFIDPNPDAASSFAERQRLFEMPRSSWADYDPALISAGGGVWDRASKSIPISAEVRAALGIDPDIKDLTPPELIRAILTSPVDLLWNGGIGTYVKASTETDADAGDKANDSVRVNGESLRCRVVGEGGNLGLTQLARIEFAQRGGPGSVGGRCNTDFIDNSAGVDTSDHEVNIKILLRSATLNGQINPESRDRLFMGMADTVADMVLADNYGQNLALANARKLAKRLFPVHIRLMKSLEKTVGLDREIEGLPSDKQLKERTAAGQGLTEPELSVLLSYVKIWASRAVLDSKLPDEDWTMPVLHSYFPAALRQTCGDHMAEHPLRREIVTTAVVNEAVNRCGTTFLFRIADETGADVVDVVRAYVIIRDAFGLRELWHRIEALDNKVPQDAQVEGLLVIRRLLDRGVRWLVQHRRGPLNVAGEIGRLRPGLAVLQPELPELLIASEAVGFEAFCTQLAEKGMPAALAVDASSPIFGFGLVDVVECARLLGSDLKATAKVYYGIAARVHLDDVLNQISALPRRNRWQTLARSALRYDLYGAMAALTTSVLQALPDTEPSDAVDLWAKRNEAEIARIHEALEEAEHSDEKLAVLSVALRQIRALVETEVD
ncbi:NAD-glutamate dehydrogenase [Glycomyces buryatensis]|uniref:NAD-glutamate dehydrogenase n=1 Tax=Glycomyces buryatensis TaxID=2570927 RepID=A0A4S8PT72_9ACTN|nr:NAD-glutamate dehydrogenase [Glycomyces buryatensis]THV34613.1 NAD-glutamate dehydrogenase [Glycomyces buryatensis]